MYSSISRATGSKSHDVTGAHIVATRDCAVSEATRPGGGRVGDAGGVVPAARAGRGSAGQRGGIAGIIGGDVLSVVRADRAGLSHRVAVEFVARFSCDHESVSDSDVAVVRRVVPGVGRPEVDGVGD